MKKYINLFIKDLVVYSNIFLFFAGFTVFMNFLTFFFFPINGFVSFISLSLLETIMFFVLYKLECKKNQGEEFLTVTSYTRENMVIYRYALAFLFIIFEFVAYCCGMLLIRKRFFSLDLFLNQLLMSCILIMILLPFSFKKSVKWFSLSYIAVAYIFGDFQDSSCVGFSPILLIFLAFAVSLVSLKLSIKMFNSQDF